MGKETAIEWADATVNLWWGCTKVGPGCDHCYAETWAGFTGFKGIWGPGAPRRKIKSAVSTLMNLALDHEKFQAEHGRRRRVFVQSMSDIFDNEVEPSWIEEALGACERADLVNIMLLTKRISNVSKMIPIGWRSFWPKHIGLMVTVVNQEEANRDIPRLLRLKKMFSIPWVGLSVEPMLGPIIIGQFTGIDLVICGGESGAKARPMHPQWAWNLLDDCRSIGAAYFHKQNGEWLDADAHGADMLGTSKSPMHQFPDGKWVVRVGKKAAGRLLYGREYSEMPEALQ